MKDTEIMEEEEKRKYIFEEASFEGRPRVKWITDCLLGDIRTFLDGIEYFKIQNKGKPAGKLPRGGGNLSVPILVNTALEFVAELYTGKTEYMKFNTDIKFEKVSEDLKREFKIRNFPLPKETEITEIKAGEEWEIKDDETKKLYYVVKIKYKPLFSIDAKFGEELNNDSISKELKEEFKTNKVLLTDNATVKKEDDGRTDKKWVITDGKKFFIKEDGTLNIYKGKKNERIFHFLDIAEYNATENTKKFILRYFPEEYKEIPSLLWDGIRNGLVHTFSPKPFEYKGSYIKFQFYVEDQNFPSHIEKVKGYLFNVEDARDNLETDLNKDIVPKELEDKFKTMNLPLPESPTAQKVKKEKKWEITNGEATLYTLEKEDKEKITVYNYIIQIRINVFELFRVLEKAVEAYLAELEYSDDLQDKFIRAFSSIEDYYRDITKDNGKLKEVKALHSGSDSSKFLLKGLNDHLSVDVLKIYSSNLMIKRS